MKRVLISLSAAALMLLFTFALAGEAAAGSAPTAQNLELTTRRNAPAEGRLSAHDADGDVVSFQITTRPVKGTIELQENGRFVYMPRANKKGRDYFGYRAVDAEGNISQEATAIIRIEK